MNDQPTAVAVPDTVTPAEPPARKPLNPGIRLAVFIAVLVATGAVLYFATRALGISRGKALDQAPLPFMIVSILVVAQGLLANYVPIQWLERRPFRTVGFRRDASVWIDIVVGLFTGALTPAITLGVLLVAGMATIQPVAVNWLSVTAPMVVAMTLVSASEEILLRGYFMQAVAAALGGLGAAIASGVIFGLMHAGNPGANPMGLIITGVNGILLAYLMVRMGSLWLACAYHAGWNLIAALVFGMRDSGMLSPGALASTELHGPQLWTGGSYGFEASVIAFVVEWFVLFALIKWGPRIIFDREAQPYFATTKRPTETPAEVATR